MNIVDFAVSDINDKDYTFKCLLTNPVSRANMNSTASGQTPLPFFYTSCDAHHHYVNDEIPVDQPGGSIINDFVMDTNAA